MVPVGAGDRSASMRRVVVRALGGGPGSARPVEDPQAPTLRSVPGWASRPGASGPPAAAACKTAPSSGHRRLIHTGAQTVGSEQQPARAGRGCSDGDQVMTFAPQIFPCNGAHRLWRVIARAANASSGRTDHSGPLGHGKPTTDKQAHSRYVLQACCGHPGKDSLSVTTAFLT
jgi:hypothetical protein